MKGIFFSLDLMVAFVLLLLVFSFSFEFLFGNFANEKEEYEKFSEETNLIKVSELMLTDSTKGLVEYEDNSVKHHLIKPEYWHLKKTEAIDGIDYHVEVLRLNEESSFNGNSISRIALCGRNLCVVKVTI